MRGEPREERHPETGRTLTVGDVGKLDLDRDRRTGVPEVILAEGKDPDDVVALARALHDATGLAVVSRLDGDLAERLAGDLPLVYHRRARIGVADSRPPAVGSAGTVGILSGGTADIRVAEEARVMAEVLGCRTVVEHDVGVAGLHRLTEALDRMVGRVDVYLVVAGREGALGPVVAGLVDRPVIGIPVSTGYGAGGGGEAALMTMLQSCSPLLVVNVDAGVVAGMMASKILRARPPQRISGGCEAGVGRRWHRMMRR